MGLLRTKRIPRGLTYADVDTHKFIIGRTIPGEDIAVGEEVPERLLLSPNFGVWLRRGFIKFDGKIPSKAAMQTARNARNDLEAAEKAAAEAVAELEELDGEETDAPDTDDGEDGEETDAGDNEPTEPPEAVKIDPAALTKAQLREELSERGVEFGANDSKKDLVDLLESVLND